MNDNDKDTNVPEDRRKSTRFRVSLSINLVFDDLDDLKQAYSKDVSEGGIFIGTDRPLPVGSELRLKISLVHQDITYVNAMAEVVHIVEPGGGRQPGMGVKFTEIDDEARAFLRDHVMEKTDKKDTRGKASAKGGKTSKGRGKQPAAKKKTGRKKSGKTS